MTGAGGPADGGEPERGARQPRPRGSVRDSFRGATAGDPLRPRVPLPPARMDRDLRQEPPGQVDAEEGARPDNSAMEGFFGRPRNELLHHRDWSGVPVPGFCRMLDGYLRYYNEVRPKERLGWMSPMQYRRSLGLAA